jgi:hypothetical protein
MQKAKPVRIQRTRKKGFNLHETSKAINGLECSYVGRGSKWGNPFRVMQYYDGKWGIKTDGTDRCGEILTTHCHFIYDTKEAAVDDAIKCYQLWLLPYKHDGGSMEDFLQSSAQLESITRELKGKNLSCWCSSESKCHADVLLKLANT